MSYYQGPPGGYPPPQGQPRGDLRDHTGDLHRKDIHHMGHHRLLPMEDNIPLPVKGDILLHNHPTINLGIPLQVNIHPPEAPMEPLLHQANTLHHRIPTEALSHLLKDHIHSNNLTAGINLPRNHTTTPTRISLVFEKRQR